MDEGPKQLGWTLGAVRDREQIPELCRQLALALAAAPPAATVVCDVSGARDPTMVTVEALARLRLTARRHGHELLLAGAGPALLDLLVITGLGAVLPLLPRASACRPGTAGGG
ncbi:MAG: STAS domain-containing protein [Frankia sp.]|nr:STAS domain-containing protein [Frankia sp.]